MLLASVAMLSCGNTDDNENNRGNNVVEGVWTNYFEDTDSVVMVRVFTADYYSFFSYAEGKSQDKLNNSRYYLNGDQIFMPKYSQAYKLSGDTLWITNSSKDQTTQYIRTIPID